MDSAQVIARFEAERQALALMDHPNIARVLDAGTTSSGRPYFVMDLVRGVPITRYCDEHHLTPRQRLELFVPVCQAIQHAHQKGIIHRDLKPSNVLVALYDGKPVPKVIDFGVAKATGQSLTDKTLVTGFGNIVGTLEYMSPEQAEFNQLDIDTRSDIYSLGVLLYELLTGSPPFSRKELEMAGMLEMLRVIREEEPSKPSTKLSTAEGLPTLAANRGTEPAKLTKLVRGELDWIVMKALEKDRNRRYETANGFAMDVQRYLADEAVQACPPSVAYRLRKFARRHKGAVLAAFLVLLALVSGIIGTTWGLIRAKDAEADAVHEAGQKERALGEKVTALGTAKAQELLARRRFYAAQMNLAMQAWEAGTPGRVLELLESQRPKLDEIDLRQFEWYYLWRLVHRQHRQTLTGHKGTVSAVAYSPDGRLLGSASHDGTVKLWDAVTARELHTLTTHRGEVHTIAFSPDGMTLACGNQDHAITLWDVPSRKEKSILRAAGPVRSVTFSPDGKTLASGDAGDCLKLWDIATGKELASLPLTIPVDSVAFSPDGKTLASAGHHWIRGHRVTLWALDGTTPKERVTLTNVRPHQHPMGGLGPPAIFSHDGKTLAAGFAETNLVDVGTGQVTIGHQLHRGDILAIALSPDGTILASAGMDRDIILWDVARSRELDRYVHPAPVYGIAFSPDGRTLASASEDRTVKLWNVSKPPDQDLLEAPTAGPALYCGCLTFLPDSKTLLAGGTSVKLWNVSTGREITTLQKEGGNVALSPDGKTIAYSHGGIANVWDLTSGQERATLNAHAADIGSLAFSPDGKTLATGADDGMVVVWDVSTGQRMDRKRYGYPVVSVAYSPNGKSLVVGGESAMVQVWDTASGNVPLVLQERDYWDWVISLTFSPDGRTLAVGNCSGRIKLYDTATWALRTSLRGHMDELRGLVFFPDGKTLVSGGSDRTVKLWDVETGQERITLIQPVGRLAFPVGDIRNKLTAVAVSPDANTLASASVDGVVKLWRAATDREATAYQHPEKPPR
jgi:WD40 repeat protein